MNTFWSINYTLEFLDRIRCLNIRSVEVFDFSTLYTNLDLVLVRDSLFKVIDKVSNSFNKILCIRFDRAFFSKKKYSSFHCFDKQKFKDAVNLF